MKKKIFTIIAILFVVIGVGIVYLNNVVLPSKIKIQIVKSLTEVTGREVSLKSLQFNIFKGLVLRELVIYDNEKPLISLREGSCSFLIMPLFKKIIIIPALKIVSPEVFIERRKDNTFNIQDLFVASGKPALSVVVNRVNLVGARIHFLDNALDEPLSKDIDLELDARLSLPSSVKFNLKSKVLDNPAVKISASGEFQIPRQELAAKISVEDLSPKGFQAYFRALGASFPGGLVEASIDLKFKQGILYAGLKAQGNDLDISRDKISARINSDISANLQYLFSARQLTYSGKATLSASSVSGLELVESVSNLNAELSFDNAGLLAEKISASVLGLPIEGRAEIKDFNNPSFKLDISSVLGLASLESLLADKFKLAFPVEIKGQGALSVAIQGKLPLSGVPKLDGNILISGASLKLDKLASPLEDINGRIRFSPDQLEWPELSFKYLGVPYKTEGVLTNFQAPGVQLEVSSKDLFFESLFSLNNKLVKLTKFSGKYFNSSFSVTADIDTARPADIRADVKGKLDVDLRDIGEKLKKFKASVEQIKPQGVVTVIFSASGNPNNIKDCALEARINSVSLSAYGLRAEGFSLDYKQADGIADIPLMRLALYDGDIEGKARLNLNSQNLPYWVEAKMQGVKIEKLKLDTAAKDKDIAGTITGALKINGFSDDLLKMSGSGRIDITEGKLWQLNLFKGLGSLLFSKDFADIVFKEGYCDFFIKDKQVFTENLKLKSNITDLAGKVKIGFDTSIDASINVQVLDEAAPVTGTFKDIATAIIGQAGRFGVINITGTLKEPKYKFKPAVMDILKSLKNAIFGQ